MRRACLALLFVLWAVSAAAQGELVCSETRQFESVHSDFIWTFQAIAGERYTFESVSLSPPHSISLCIWSGDETLTCSEVESSADPARICGWEAPATGNYLLIQVHSGGTFAVTMQCGTACTTTRVEASSWARIKALFR